jgi:chemotaxis response regulator CheB
MQQVERDYLEKAMMELEARRNELMSREMDMLKRQVDNHNERNKLYHEKKQVIYFGSSIYGSNALLTLINTLEDTCSDRLLCPIPLILITYDRLNIFFILLFTE